MIKFLKTKGLRLLAVVLAVVILAAVVSGVRGGNAGFFSNAAATVTRPLRQAATAVAGWLEDVYGYLYRYNQLQAENAALQAQVAELQSQLREAEEAVEENSRLRALLDFEERHSDFVLESTRIVDWTASNWTRSFTISKGEDADIALGDCVITEAGVLVGQVTELGSNWATVRTVIDVDANVGALVGEAGNAAMLVGDFTLMQSGQAKLTYLTEGTQLLEGDSVLTSGKGGVFPQGLLVGTIAEVHTEAGGQTPYGVVEPACDLDNLSQVFVIKDFNVVE